MFVVIFFNKPSNGQVFISVPLGLVQFTVSANKARTEKVTTCDHKVLPPGVLEAEQNE